MRVNLTLQKLKKIHDLPHEDFIKLVEVIRKKGIVDADDAPDGYYDVLRAVKLIKSRAGKMWTSFDVNGVNPCPIMGRGKRNRVSTEPQKFVGMYLRKFKKVYNESYGAFNSEEWAHSTRLCKQYDFEELSLMVDAFFRMTVFVNADVRAFMGKRNRLHREVLQSKQEILLDEESGDELEEGGGW